MVSWMLRVERCGGCVLDGAEVCRSIMILMMMMVVVVVVAAAVVMVVMLWMMRITVAKAQAGVAQAT